MKPNAIIYDCEIIKAIPNRDGSQVDGIAYCDGWRDFANMGISVIGVYDYAEDRYRVFCADNAVEFTKLCTARDLCVGFNNIPFDNALIRATPGWNAPGDLKCYDLLREVWIAAGLGPEFNFKTHGGYGLDAVCEANFGTKKSGNGAFAPVLWQQGKIGEVIDYCLNDVRLTKQLFDAALDRMPLVNPKSEQGGGHLILREPFPSEPIRRKFQNGQYYAKQADGHMMLCNADGTRSIFDDIDE